MSDFGIFNYLEGLSAAVLIVFGIILLVVGEVAKWVIRLLAAVLLVIGAYELLTGLNFFQQVHP